MSTNNKELLKRDYLKEITNILSSEKSQAKKKELLLQYHQSDIAEVLDVLTEEKRKELYAILGVESLGEVLLYSEAIEELVEDIEPEVLADILETMDADDAVDVLEELDEKAREEIVGLIEDKEVLTDIITLSKYSEDVIGSEMTNNYIIINTSDTVKSAMKKVIKQASENDNVSTIYVLDHQELFYGVLELRDLIIAREGDDLNKIIKTNYPYFYDEDLITDIIPQIKDTD